MSRAGVWPFATRTTAAPVARRSGLVRVVGPCLEDDGGPWPALGTTLFPARHLYRHDRDRLRRNLDVLVAAGFADFVRDFSGAVGVSWADRYAAPNDLEAFVGCSDLLWSQYGLRMAPVIAADGDADPTFRTQAAREVVIDQWAACLRGREAQTLLVEPVNEWENGPKIGLQDLRDLTQRLQQQTSVPVVPSAAGSPAGEQALYEGLGARLANRHGERDRSADGGLWEPVWKPYERFWARTDATALAWLEPIGPGASGRSDSNPLRLVLAAWMTHLAGCTAYVYHTGPGIRLGGAWDRLRGIPETLDGTDGWVETTAGLRQLRALMPPDIGRWTRFAGHRDECAIDFRRYRRPLPDGRRDNGPFDDGTIFKALVATSGSRLVGAVLGLARPIDIATTRAGTLALVDPLTGRPFAERRLGAGEWWTITPRPATGPAPDRDGFLLFGEF